MRPATIIGWTGKGRLSELEESVLGSLLASRVAGVRMRKIGGTLVGSGVEPSVVSGLLARLPGVSWVAYGYDFSKGLEECVRSIAILASRYLSRGMSFNVSAAVGKSAYSEGDLILAANSKILSKVKGTRVDEKKPKVKFRISLTGSVGACGIQIREGVGGVPTSKRRVAYCLLSGGRHSSVAAWMAALSGFSLRLVHLKVDDESLRQVAKLYSELSHRMDPAQLSLEIVEGRGKGAQILRSWLADAKRIPVFVGGHLECDGEVLEYAYNSTRRLLFPVLVMQEEEVLRMYRDLGMKERDESASGILKLESVRDVKYKVKSFGRARADTHTVLDSMLR